jgi:hypothetical protein
MDVYTLCTNYHIENPFQLIYNYTTIDWFFDMVIYLLIPRISKGIVAY